MSDAEPHTQAGYGRNGEPHQHPSVSWALEATGGMSVVVNAANSSCYATVLEIYTLLAPSKLVKA